MGQQWCPRGAVRAGRQPFKRRNLTSEKGEKKRHRGWGIRANNGGLTHLSPQVKAITISTKGKSPWSPGKGGQRTHKGGVEREEQCPNDSCELRVNFTSRRKKEKRKEIV